MDSKSYVQDVTLDSSLHLKIYIKLIEMSDNMFCRGIYLLKINCPKYLKWSCSFGTKVKGFLLNLLYFSFSQVGTAMNML